MMTHYVMMANTISSMYLVKLHEYPSSIVKKVIHICNHARELKFNTQV